MNQTTVEAIAIVVTIIALSIPAIGTVHALRSRLRAGGPLLRWHPTFIRLLIFIWWVVGTITAVILFNHGARPLIKIIYLCAFVIGFLNITVNLVIIGEKGIFIHRNLILWNSITSFSFWTQGKLDFTKIVWHHIKSNSMKEITFPLPPNRKTIVMTLFRNFVPSMQVQQENRIHEN